MVYSRLYIRGAGYGIINPNILAIPISAVVPTLSSWQVNFMQKLKKVISDYILKFIFWFYFFFVIIHTMLVGYWDGRARWNTWNSFGMDIGMLIINISMIYLIKVARQEGRIRSIKSSKKYKQFVIITIVIFIVSYTVGFIFWHKVWQFLKFLVQLQHRI
ncbi:MAG: hypothetical protein N3A72_01235 [bacterium]|nr:hypothetical protein [bacterium]